MAYFDHNATAPLLPRAREAWLAVQDEAWHNPSTLYRAGARARLRLDAERERLADYLGAKPDRLIFSSGATEGVQAVFAYWKRLLPADGLIWVNPTEHACVLQAAEWYWPGRVRFLAVNRSGTVLHPQEQGWNAAERPAAVAVMAANNETGVLQPWQDWALWCAERGIPFLCDASQWVGKLSAGNLGEAAWVVATAHKWGGPRGVGFVLQAPHAKDFRLHAGGLQESGRRGGTEDLPGITASGAALVEHEQKRVFLESERCLWRDRFIADLKGRCPGVSVVGEEVERLWNTVCLLMPKGGNQRWVTLLDKAGHQISTGAACSAGKESPSHVLAALGVEPLTLRRGLRVSSGWETTPEDWGSLAEAFERVFRELPEDEVR